MCKVSICIPTYNNSEKVKRLLDSVCIQTYKDYEIIISDNSDDTSVQEIINNYHFDRIKYIHNDNNIGPVANWNNTLEVATGIYIKIMFADDWFAAENSLEKFVNMLETHSEIELAFSGTYQVDENNISRRAILPEDASKLLHDTNVLFIGNYIGAPSAVIYRNNKMKFDTKLKWLVDLELYMRLLERGGFIYTEEPLVSIGISQEQMTMECKKDWILQLREYKYIYFKHKLYKNIFYTCHLIKVYFIGKLNKLGANIQM